MGLRTMLCGGVVGAHTVLSIGCLLVLVLASALGPFPAAAAAAAASSAQTSGGVQFYAVAGGFGVTSGDWEQPQPVQLELVSTEGAVAWLRGVYDSVVSVAVGSGSGRATGLVRTPAGSELLVVDVYESSTAGFTMERRVTVQHKAAGDAAFSSRFSLQTKLPTTTRQREMFMPGIWYANSTDASPPRALAGDLDARHVLVREDRLPLPLVMARAPSSGATTVLVHEKPDGASFSGEDFKPRLVDARLQFGSVGVVNEGHLQLAFQFPGSEGDRTYVRGPPSVLSVSKQLEGWANRSHPLSSDLEHTYSLRVTHSSTANFSVAVRDTWRAAFASANPVPPRADLARVFNVSVSVIGHYAAEYDGVPLVPFCANISDGAVAGQSSQMGFVGKATPAAALLLHSAVMTHDQAQSDRAESIIDFWVNHSMNPSGVPKTWFDPHPGGNITWRKDTPYMGHLRIMSEGVKGVLDAWWLLRRPTWLAYARQFGDFLVRNQATDGSIAGEWTWDGQVYANFTNCAAHPVPFLLDLARATGDGRYQQAAIKAGLFVAPQMRSSYHYIGGACDNPNVLDKEAGFLALQAFLALYDATQDRAWVAHAAQAADFCETWTYAWNVPIPKDDPDVVYPLSRTVYGASLIATGQSGADNFMAIAYFSYYQLYNLTGDTHYLEFSQFLADATKQVMDWDGTLHYPLPGMMNEAVTFVTHRGHGVRKWLPWLSVAVLEPMLRMNETFGYFFPQA